MTENIIIAKVKNVLAQKLKVNEDQILRTSLLRDDLGIDSVEILDVVSLMEEAFGTKIPEEELAKIQTVDDIIDALRERVKK